ncbi:MAG: ATP-binding cassette domain-containing protein, partial [Reyranella sp.]|nr:ATP-binding cassette domain-containing protein [Reyranella sp.]
MQALTPAAAAIELRGIDKSFGVVHAVRGVSLRIEAGTITGIVGENGAGKSTLMSILYGLYRADAGEIWVDGQPVEMTSPRDAIAHGIGMVHQHFMLIDTFTVLENMVLGAEGGLLLAGGLAAARAELVRLGRDYGLTIDPDARVADLSVGEQQRVEILKVLFRGARTLILDEPSAVLTPQETDQLFRILGTLKERGVTIVLITHKLREIVAATDRVYVMRQGKVVAERRTIDTGTEELAELMIGRKVRLDLDKAP